MLFLEDEAKKILNRKSDILVVLTSGEDLDQRLFDNLLIQNFGHEIAVLYDQLRQRPNNKAFLH
jgi:hypothetical protein